MKIKPSGGGGARTLFRSPRPPPSHVYDPLALLQHTWRLTEDKRAGRVQSQYFQKASAEALKATGEVRFFYTLACRKG